MESANFFTIKNNENCFSQHAARKFIPEPKSTQKLLIQQKESESQMVE